MNTEEEPCPLLDGLHLIGPRSTRRTALMTDFANTGPRENVIHDIRCERMRQVQKWGNQSHSDVGHRNHRKHYLSIAGQYQAINDGEGEASWDTILLEEVYEALAEGDPKKLREELIQVAAVAAAWAEDIDTRG